MATIRKLTQRQEEIYKMIEQNIRERGTPPTRAEIATQMGFKSANAAEDHLKALARKGLLTLIPGTSRGIRLVEEQNLGIPVIKSAASLKAPLLAPENIQRHLKIDAQLFNPEVDYFLPAPDSSMNEHNIFIGDYIGVHKTKETYTGQIIIAFYRNQLLIRKFKRNFNEITLESGCAQHKPITLERNDPHLNVEGICVGIIRTNI
jgi:repressor LexA